MKKIDERKYESYTIVYHGSNITLVSLAIVLRSWKEYGPGSVLYGNRYDGVSEILDSK